MGIGLDDDNLHAPHEQIELDQFFKGNEAAAYLFEELGAPGAMAGGRKTKRTGR
jgi:hypothetical protein